MGVPGFREPFLRGKPYRLAVDPRSPEVKSYSRCRPEMMAMAGSRPCNQRGWLQGPCGAGM